MGGCKQRQVGGPASPSSPSSDGSRALPASLRNKAKAPPKTGYEFERTLEACKTPQAVAEYMSIVKPGSVPKLLRQNLTSDMMMELVAGVMAGLEGGAQIGLKWLQALPKVNRFDIIVDFLSSDEKARIGATLDRLDADGAEVDSQLRAAYKL